MESLLFDLPPIATPESNRSLAAASPAAATGAGAFATVESAGATAVAAAPRAIAAADPLDVAPASLHGYCNARPGIDWNTGGQAAVATVIDHHGLNPYGLR